jgi:hypothetical protein
MTGIVFDTLSYANKLKEGGMNEVLANIHAEQTSKILNDLTSTELVTRQYLKDEMRELEIRMYSFMAKTALFTVSILGSIQTLFHFIK